VIHYLLDDDPKSPMTLCGKPVDENLAPGRGVHPRNATQAAPMVTCPQCLYVARLLMKKKNARAREAAQIGPLDGFPF